MVHETFAVVIGDTVASREIADRDAYQARLTATLDGVNELSRPASAYTISAGDGIEAVYRDPRKLFIDLLSILGAVYPQRIRFAVALGELATALDPHNPLLADGPAFHAARRGMERLKREDEMLRLEPSDLLFLENDALRLLAHHLRSFKQTRWHVLRELTRGRPKVEIGPVLGISTVAAYKSIRTGALEVVLSLAEDLGRSLADRL